MELSKHETEWLKTNGAKMLLELGIKPNDHVIDYGCGEGRYTIPLSQIVTKQGCVYSVERNENAINITQNKLLHFSNPDIVQFLNVNQLEKSSILPEKSIDAILAFDVLQYIENWDLLFCYFQKVIKPKGIICIYPAEVPHPRDVDIKLITSKMKKIGFKPIQSKQYKMMHSVDLVYDQVYTFSLE